MNGSQRGVLKTQVEIQRKHKIQWKCDLGKGAEAERRGQAGDSWKSWTYTNPCRYLRCKNENLKTRRRRLKSQVECLIPEGILHGGT